MENIKIPPLQAGLTNRSTRTLPLPVAFTTATRRFGSAG